MEPDYDMSYDELYDPEEHPDAQGWRCPDCEQYWLAPPQGDRAAECPNCGAYGEEYDA